MQAEWQAYFLEQIRDDWFRINPGGRPDTYWVAEHLIATNEDFHLSSPVVAAWYFDGRSYSARDPSSFAAFMNLGVRCREDRVFEIGYGGFAPLENSEDVAAYYQFAGLFGQGYHFVREASGSFVRHDTWRS